MHLKIEQLEANYKELAREIVRVRQLLEDQYSLRPQFLESSPLNKSFGERVDDMIKQVIQNKSLSINIMGYFDHNHVNKLQPCAERVRIISRDRDVKKDITLLNALNMMLGAGSEVRTNDQLHARLIQTEKSVIVGSADLEADCISGNRIDACIWSNHPEIVESTKIFFQRIWDKSESLGETIILFDDFEGEEHKINSEPKRNWEVYKGSGNIIVTDEIKRRPKSTRCVKITSPNGSTTYMLYKFRESKKLKIDYYLRQEEFNEGGNGAAFHVFHTPINVDRPIPSENEAIHMAIREKELYYYDTTHHHFYKIQPKKWYHIILEIDCTEHKFTCYVNGEKFEGNFRYPLENVDVILTTPWRERPEWTTYIDQVKITKTA